jgi:LmbE family N-acetylglucosaminyl deacetylase
MLSTIRMRLANSLKELHPGHLRNELSATPFVDFATLIPPGHRIVVVAPHPDDEVIGCGGLLAAAAERNDNPVALIAVTDGEACYPPSRHCTRQQLAAIRRAESMEALTRLGLTPASIARLGLPDGEVRKNSKILVQQLQRLLRPADVVITTWRHDGHADHDAVGAVAAGRPHQRGAQLIEVPIWAWHRPAVGELRSRGVRASRLALTTRWEVRKEYALEAYASQVRPPAPLPSYPALAPHLLGSWLRDWEAMFF